MPGGIWEAIGQALQSGGRTFQGLKADEQDRIGRQRQLDIENALRHHQALQQDEEFALQKQDRVRKILESAIEHTNPNQELSQDFVSRVKTDAPDLMNQITTKKAGTLENFAGGGLGMGMGGVAPSFLDVMTRTPTQKENNLAEDRRIAAGDREEQDIFKSHLRDPAHLKESFDTQQAEAMSHGMNAQMGSGEWQRRQDIETKNKLKIEQARVAGDLAVAQARQGSNPLNLQGAPGTGVAGEAALEGLAPKDVAMVKKLANYELPFPTGTASKDPYWKALIQKAVEYDPSFDATQYQTRAALRKSFTSGKDAQNVKSLNTLISHVDKLSKSGDALGNGNYPTLNAVTNFFSQGTGNPEVTNFDMNANAVAEEAATLFKGTGGTDQEIKSWKQNFTHNLSPEQKRGAIKTLFELLNGRAGAMDSQYRAGMGKPADFTLLNDDSRNIMKALGVEGGAPQAPQAPTNAQAPATSQRTMTVDQVNRYAKAKGVSPVEMLKTLQAEGVVIQ